MLEAPWYNMRNIKARHIDRTCVLVTALCHQPKAFASDLADDQSRYLLVSEVYCRFAELPVIDNLRCRLLALRLLETVLPMPRDTVSTKLTHFEPLEQRQIVDTLLSNMSAAMWSSPVPEAVKAVTQKKCRMEANIAELSASDCQPVSGMSTVSHCSSTDIADVTFDVDKMLNCTVENGRMLIHGAGGRGYGLAGIPISSGCYQWKVRHHHHHHVMCLCTSLK